MKMKLRMKKSEKALDSVRLMRDLRDALCKEMQGLTFEQQRELIRERLRSSRASHAGVK